MLFKSQVYTQASGSVGGVTYSRSPSGMYARGRAVPVNPGTRQQTRVRALLGLLSGLWQSLSVGERDLWSVYGDNVPVTNRLGDSINLSGINHFIRSNAPRLQSEANPLLARVDSGPTTFNLSSFTPISALASVAAGLAINFDATDDWANEDGASMLIYMSAPNSPGRVYNKGPYRLVGTRIDGDATTPPTSPVAIPLVGLPHPYVVNQAVNVRAQVTRADGRLSNSQTIPGIIATA